MIEGDDVGNAVVVDMIGRNLDSAAARWCQSDDEVYCVE